MTAATADDSTGLPAILARAHEVLALDGWPREPLADLSVSVSGRC
jgi:hypothetical protein